MSTPSESRQASACKQQKQVSARCGGTGTDGNKAFLGDAQGPLLRNCGKLGELFHG